MMQFEVSYDGAAHGAMRLAEVLRMDSRRLDTEIGAYVADYLQGGEPLMEREMADADELLVCPVAHALARASGYEIAGLVLMRRLRCVVDVRRTDATRRAKLMHALADDWVLHDAAIGAGLTWEPPRGPGSPASVLVDAERVGIPHVVGALLTGRPLRGVLSHPVVDAHDLGIVEVREDHPGEWRLILDRAPAMISLEEAVYG